MRACKCDTTPLAQEGYSQAMPNYPSARRRKVSVSRHEMMMLSRAGRITRTACLRSGRIIQAGAEGSAIWGASAAYVRSGSVESVPQLVRHFSSSGEDSSQTVRVGDEAKIDMKRSSRTGFPEVVYALHKSDEQVVTIVKAMLEHREQNGKEEGPYNSPIVASRVSEQQAQLLLTQVTQGKSIRYVKEAQLVLAESSFDATDEEGNRTYLEGNVAIVAAGTSDLPVAEEAAWMLKLAGVKETSIKRYYDVGVAGIYRLLDASKHMHNCTAIIAVAGMDGAMPSALAGLVKAPIVAIPTSVGYGAAFAGVAPLLTMLNSCAPGVSVVNIDNGIGAAAVVVKMLSTSSPKV